MARIEKKKISWNESESADVQAYRVYYKPDPDGTTVFDYTDPYIETEATQVQAPDDFPEGAFSEEGDYLIGVSAVDDVGNESDITEISHPFDLHPPMAPTGLSVS